MNRFFFPDHSATSQILTDLAFHFYQERRLLKLSLSVPDVHLISLKPELEGLIVPSKLYGIAAAGRPIIVVAASDGEIAGLVRRHDCGIVVEPGRGEFLVDALHVLRGDPDRLAAMGRRARAMLDTHFTGRHAFTRWQNVIEEVAGSTPRVLRLSAEPDHGPYKTRIRRGFLRMK